MAWQLVLSCLCSGRRRVLSIGSTGLYVLFLAAALPAMAHDKESITALSVVPAGGWIIDADGLAGNPSSGRDKITVSATVHYTAATAGAFRYRLGFSLRDAAGAAHPIIDEDGRSNLVYYAYETVPLPSGGFSSRAHTVLLKPAARLSWTNTYHAQLDLYQADTNTGSAFKHTGVTRAGAPHSFYHFTNRISGDTARNAIVTMDNATYTRTYLINAADSGKDAFRVQADFTVRRYDDFQAAASEATIPVYVTADLRDAATGLPIPLQSRRELLSFGLVPSCDRTGAVPKPVTAIFSASARFRPQIGHQLNPVSKRYILTLRLEHDDKSDAGAAWLGGNTFALAPQGFLHFNGMLRFGGIETVFDSVANDPGDDGTGVPGSYIGTKLAVRNKSGFLLDDSGYAYGDGALLDVKLLPNGDAELRSGAVTAVPLASDVGELAGIRFRRLPPVRLSPSGGKCDVRVYLPAGMGHSADQQSLVLDDWLDSPSVLLGPGLIPIGSVTNHDRLYFSKDTLPLRVETTRTVWKPQEGTLILTASAVSYVRALELLRLEQADVEEPSLHGKKSNEQVFRFAETITSDIIVRADAGGSARWSLNLSFAPGQFVSHFPYGSAVGWQGAGSARLNLDRFVPAESLLTGVGNVTVSYAQSCPTADCPAGVRSASIELKLENQQLAFTTDGGLAGTGIVLNGSQLAWGALENNGFVHRTTAFENGSFAMPGYSLRGGSSSLEVGLLPGVLLLSGVDSATRETTDRPFNPAYALGRGDYAGINLRVPAKSVRATSIIAGRDAGSYELAPQSKYYVRQAGVSGIHQAIDGAAPSSLLLYGYPAGFTSFGLSYLDSQNVGSRTDGYLRVPYPSDFTLPMEDVRFTCIGDLGGPLLSQSSGTNHLEYWNADFVAHTMEIQRKQNMSCVPGSGTLVVGLSTYASHIPMPLHGTIGFKPDGNILTQSDGLLDDVTSQLALPNTLELAGPENGSYHLRTSRKAYFNNHDTSPAQELFGWINIYGTLDLPYFQDMPVHIQTSAGHGDSNALVHITGGWNDAAGNTFERNPEWDTEHKGYPPNTSLTAYRRPEAASDQKYLPRAKQRLLQIVPLEYPLAWNSGARFFKSSEPVRNDLLLLNVEHQLKYLGPRSAEVKFGAQYEGLPRMNLVNLALNALPDGRGVASTIAGVIGGQAHGRLLRGIGSLDQLMSERMDMLFEEPLGALWAPALDAMEAVLRQRYAQLQPGEDWHAVADDVIDSFTLGTGTEPVLTPLRQRLRTFLAIAPGQHSLLTAKLDSNLLQIVEALDSLVGTSAPGNPSPLFSPGLGGSRDAMRNAATELLRNLAPAHYNDGMSDSLGSLLQRAEPAIAQVFTSLQASRSQLTTIRQGLASDLSQELAAAGAGASDELDGITEQIRADLKQALRSANYQVSSPFSEFTPEQLKAQWKSRMNQRFFSSGVPTRVQAILRSRFYDVEAALQQAMTSGFEQINRVMEDAVSGSLATLDRHIEPFFGDLSAVMGAGQLDGYARIVGDSVPELRLDGKLQWRVPDALEFRGFVLIKQKASEGDRGSCYAPGANVTEITVGAEDMEISWTGDGIRADVGAKFTLNANLAPIGLAGYFNQTAGSIRFQSAAVSELSAALALGAQENYLSGHAALDLSGYGVEGGMFFGRTCDLTPILLIDEDVAEILGEPKPSFTGAYLYGEGEMPIVDYGCVFNISAGVGAGLFYFAEGPTYGGKMMAKVSGEALCTISVKGKIEMLGAKRGDDLSFKGKGRVKGKVGWCPFCKRFKKTVTLTYKNREWDADY